MKGRHSAQSSFAECAHVVTSKLLMSSFRYKGMHVVLRVFV